MINGLGVLGWGVGGIDAEAALLGQAYIFPRPEVVGVRLVGKIVATAMTTDAALYLTQILRQSNVTGCAVEFFGEAVADLPVAVRATFANMAPEYGATCGFFPVDNQTIEYLRQTGRAKDHIQIVEHYCRSNSLWRDDEAPRPEYDRIVEIDLSQALPSVAGPRRPQDRLPLNRVAADFQTRLFNPLSDGGFAVGDQGENNADSCIPGHGSIALAAITSCTNTSNPIVMLAAGLVAQKAVSYGLVVPQWVKTSMAPGSRVVARYLENSGLMKPLEQLGFNVVGYGCTTCGGKSGPLSGDVSADIERRHLVVASVLSGNRNFEGRIHRQIRANYIMSPPLVVLYALAGRIDIDFEKQPVSYDAKGNPVYMQDLWPTSDEISKLLSFAQDTSLYNDVYEGGDVENSLWDGLSAPTGSTYAWDKNSHYLVPPPFFTTDGDEKPFEELIRYLSDARALAVFEDSLTTDHISPSGEIPIETPAGQYLLGKGIPQKDFNTYVGRRGNFEVMTRATFANIRIKNLLVPGREGGVTLSLPNGKIMSIYDAARSYREAGIGAIILAGKEYGTGSSRDWAAKGSALLGIRAILAESYERIHRANLVGMGVLPLQFVAGQGWRQLGLTGHEKFSFSNIEAAISHGVPVQVTAQSTAGTISFEALPQLLTVAERKLMQQGGILKSVLHDFLSS